MATKNQNRHLFIVLPYIRGRKSHQTSVSNAKYFLFVRRSIYA